MHGGKEGGVANEVGGEVTIKVVMKQGAMVKTRTQVEHFLVVNTAKFRLVADLTFVVDVLLIMTWLHRGSSTNTATEANLGCISSDQHNHNQHKPLSQQANQSQSLRRQRPYL